jgi:hypothetical protein
MLFVEKVIFFKRAAVAPHSRETAGGPLPEVEPGVNALFFQAGAPVRPGAIVRGDSADNSGVKEAEVFGDDLSQGKEVCVQGLIPVKHFPWGALYNYTNAHAAVPHLKKCNPEFQNNFVRAIRAVRAIRGFFFLKKRRRKQSCGAAGNPSFQ